MTINVFQLDDDPSQLKLLEKVFEKNEEFNFKGFSQASDFIMALKNSKPDICLIDLNLSEGFGVGYQVLEAIRNKFSNDLPIFILSRRNTNRDITNAFELGATDYIIKPIDPLLITEKIKSYLKPKDRSDLAVRSLVNPIRGKIKMRLRFLTLNESYLILASDHFF